MHVGEDGSLKVGILEYLVDGVIPLLHTFYYCYFNPVDAPSNAIRDREVQISALIFSNLVVCLQSRKSIEYNNKLFYFLCCVVAAK